jgi:hypothetical protein
MAAHARSRHAEVAGSDMDGDQVGIEAARDGKGVSRA